MREYYQMTEQETRDALDSKNGLTSEEASKRQENTAGTSWLKERKKVFPRSFWNSSQIFLLLS